ncbi:MAG: methionyl-tRNA formyltransferase [Actinomycetota bacterium]|jgi:methionyl-tRNA formyltransferase
MRVVFLGNDLWSVPSLEAVAGSTHDVALVITRDPRPAGRGGAPRATAVATAAREAGLPLLEIATVKQGAGLEAVRQAAPDVLVVVAYGEILPGDVLDVPTVAPVNVHFSLLPALRGADPVRRAILEGYATTGVTTIRMDEGMDTGPVLLQVPEAVRDEDDAGSLGARLASLGGRVLVETLNRLAEGNLEEQPQDHHQATMAPKLRPEEEWIVWSEDAEAVRRRVRALAPDPGARTTFRGRGLKILRVVPGEPGLSGTAGTVVEVSKHRLVVAAGSGSVALETVVPEGRPPMAGEDWARGQRPEVGEPFGG